MLKNCTICTFLSALTRIVLSVNNIITYEFPLNEKIRIFIRLEHLFNQFIHFSANPDINDKRAAISVLLDIISIFKRTDLRSEVLKELTRQNTVLKKISNNEGVNKEKLQGRLDQVDEVTKKLHGMTEKKVFGNIDNSLLQSIAQRSSIPGGSCSFDLPEYHYWLTQSEEDKVKDLENWFRPFVNINTALTYILNSIRNSCNPKSETALAGFYQIALDQNQPYQLIRLDLDKSIHCFAEISGGKHRCNIRFMEVSPDNKSPVQCVKDIPFTLTRCLFS